MIFLNETINYLTLILEVTVNFKINGYKSFFTNFLKDKSMGTAIHTNSINIENIIPNPLPKKFLNIAPVYPMRAEISNLSKSIILARSTGFNAANIIIGVSKG